MRNLISREIKSTIITAKVLYVESEEIAELSTEVYEVVPEEKAKQKFESENKDKNIMVIKVLSITPKSTMYGMTIEEFVMNAHELDEKRNYI